jgi:hypothetical protein
MKWCHQCAGKGGERKMGAFCLMTTFLQFDNPVVDLMLDQAFGGNYAFMTSQMASS